MGHNNCWICGLRIVSNGPDELRRSKDHIVPKCQGGGITGNIKYAHRWCNSKRGHAEVTDGMCSEFRESLVDKYPKKFVVRPAGVAPAS